MARPRTQESRIRETLLDAKPRGLSWKQLQEQTKLPRSTVTTILHRMVKESKAIATLDDRDGRPTPVYHYSPRAQWRNRKRQKKDTTTHTNATFDEKGNLIDAEYVTEYKRLHPKARLGGDMYSQAKQRVKIPKERWDAMQARGRRP